MKSQEIDGSGERMFLIGCITNKDFLSRVSGRAGKEPLRSKEGNTLYNICKKYYLKYGKPPKTAIESLTENYFREYPDKDNLSRTQRLLSSLSGQYEKLDQDASIDYYLDVAQGLLNEILLERHKTELEEDLSRGDIAKSVRKIQAFSPIDLKRIPYTSIFSDKKAQRESLEASQNVLIAHSGPAGVFFGEELSEDSFVAFMASAKGGKSYVLLDMAWKAFKQGRKVAYFQVGDLSHNQIMRRFHRRAAYRPINAGPMQFPVSIVIPPGYKDLAVVENDVKEYEKPISWPLAKKAFEKVRKKYKGDIRLSYHQVMTVNMMDIKNTLDSWDQDGWVAKVVIIDYAGNLFPVDSRMEPHRQVAHSWALMRQLSEKRKCLVLTANQTNKEGFSSWVLTRKHFSESKMILAHVTSFLGVNQTDEEKGRNIMRLNFVVRREDAYRESFCLYNAQCLAIGNPMVLSALPQE